MEWHKGIPEDVGKECEEQQDIPPLFCQAPLPRLTWPETVDEGEERSEWERPYEEMEEVLGNELPSEHKEIKEGVSVADVVSHSQWVASLQVIIREQQQTTDGVTHAKPQQLLHRYLSL